MLNDVAQISVVTRPAMVGACALCNADPVDLTDVVVVRHSRGGTVDFVACGRCALAVRRVAAAAGAEGHTLVSDAMVAREVAAQEPLTAPHDEAFHTAEIGGGELIRETIAHIRAPDGSEYQPRVYGRLRADGLCEGWIEFVGIGSAVVLSTDRETTQSSRQDLVYWASGLESAYFEGAFQRARQVRPVG